MKTKPLISALNEMLRCYDYGKVTTKIEWATAASNARNALDAVKDKRRGFKRSPLNPGTRCELVPIEPSPFLVQTTSETLTAYADCQNDSNEESMRNRNLSFKSAHTVTVAEAMAIFKKATPGGYNAFKAHCLRHIPDDRMLYLAREGSPCVYVVGPEFEQTKGMLADEFTFFPKQYVKTYGDNQFTVPGPVTRVWWD
jgi:hypothetical protein